MIPGVQKPHCEPPVATKRGGQVVAHGGIESFGGDDRRARRRACAGVTHATRGSPSTSTVQHPH